MSIKSQIKTRIKDFLCNLDQPSISLELCCPNLIIEAIEECGGMVDMDTIDTNGWQWDWWLQGEYKSKSLSLSGCGWYGDAKLEWI